MSENDYYQDRECAEIAEYYDRFNIPINRQPTLLSPPVLKARADFIQEELKELYKALETPYKLDEVVDALVDIVYVTKGTAVMMGLQWGNHFDEVHYCNQNKERGLNKKRPELPYDFIKPTGWKGPNHEAILEKAQKE